MILKEGFVDKLKAANSPDDVYGIIDSYSEEKKEESSKPVEENESSKYIVGVTACPNGVAHTYMAQEALENAAKKLNAKVKIETNGSDGVKID